MFEEDLATTFSIDAIGAPLEAALSISPDALAWLDRNWERLLVDHQSRWKLPVSDERWLPPDGLGYDPTWHGPSTFDNPPPKWGYYVGMRWADARRTRDWTRDLALTRVWCALYAWPLWCDGSWRML